MKTHSDRNDLLGATFLKDRLKETIGIIYFWFHLSIDNRFEIYLIQTFGYQLTLQVLWT